MFETTGMERAAELLENPSETVEKAGLEQSTEAMEQANLEQELDIAEQGILEHVIEPSKAVDMDGMMDALDLTPQERIAFAAIDSELMDMPVENASGNAKVRGDCGYSTCTYTTTYYSCPSTKP